MSRLITASGAIDDPYRHLGDDEPVPEAGAISVSIDRWRQASAEFAERADPVGVRLGNSLSLSDADPSLLARPLIVLDFPAFADGRAYSQARILRQRHAYSGELRARGNAVVVDQIGLMRRCGIDSFELRSDQNQERAIAALKGSHSVYQAAVNDPGPSVRQQRRKRPAA